MGSFIAIYVFLGMSTIGKVEAYSSFIVTIYGSSVKGTGEDKMCWTVDRN